MRIDNNKTIIGLCLGMAIMASILTMAIVTDRYQGSEPLSKGPSTRTTFTFPPEAKTPPADGDTIPVPAGDGWREETGESISVPRAPITERRDIPGTADILPEQENPTVHNACVRQRGNGIVSAFIQENASLITLRATPDPGYRFNGWYRRDELISNETHLRLTTDTDNNVTARFIPQTHVIECVAAGNGTVSGGGTYRHGDPVRLTATPAYGYDLMGWYENGERISPAHAYDTEADRPRVLEARFSDNGLRQLCANIQEAPNTLSAAGIDKHNVTLSINKLSLLKDSLLLVEIETTNHAKTPISLSPASFSYKAQDIRGRVSTKALNPIYAHDPPARLEGKGHVKTTYVFDPDSVPTRTDIDIEQSKDKDHKIRYRLRNNTIKKVKEI